MRETDPGRVVLAVDVLAAAVAGGSDPDDPARRALDLVLGHDAVALVASDALLDDAAALVAERDGPIAARELRNRVEAECIAVSHPADDDPAVAAAYQSGAAHIVTRDSHLLGAEPAATLRPLRVSVRTPDAFVRVFDPDALPAEGGTSPD